LAGLDGLSLIADGLLRAQRVGVQTLERGADAAFITR
jgi:hypothetical protein